MTASNIYILVDDGAKRKNKKVVVERVFLLSVI